MAKNRSGKKEASLQSLSLLLKVLNDSRFGVDKEHLMRNIGLNPDNESDNKQFQRFIHATLIPLGYPIEYDEEIQRYRLDKNRSFEIHATGYDLSLLAAAIRNSDNAARSRNLHFVLENALSKLHAKGISHSYESHRTADIPAEDLLFHILSAIERKKRLRFQYHATVNKQGQWREFEPYLVFSRSRVFYACGRAREWNEEKSPSHTALSHSSDSMEEFDLLPEDFFLSDVEPFLFDTEPDKEQLSLPAFDSHNKNEWQWRTYRISRIDTASFSETGNRIGSDEVQTAQGKVRHFFDNENVILALKPGKAQALRAIAEKTDYSSPNVPSGWDCYRLARVERRFLRERLMTYGRDIRLIAPDDIRRQWAGTLTHLVSMTEKTTDEKETKEVIL